MIDLARLADRAVCITTPERWPSGFNMVARQFAARGVVVEPMMNFWPGERPNDYDGRWNLRSDPPEGMRFAGSWHHSACFRRIIARAQQDMLDTILIIEDDVILRPEFDATLAAIDHLPSWWQVFYLGGQHDGGANERMTPNLLGLHGGTQSNHCALYHRSVFADLLALPLNRPIDSGLADITQTRGHCYSAWPSIAIQSPGISTITGEMGGWPFLFDKSGVPGESPLT